MNSGKATPRSMRSAIVLGLFALLGCQTSLPPPRSGLGLPASELFNRVRHVCLEEHESGVVLDEPDAKKKTLEAILSDELRTIGFNVVGSQEVTALYKRIAEEEGGYFDIHAGRTIPEKKAKIDHRFYVVAQEELNCDAIATALVVEVEAPYWNGGARWDRAQWRPGLGLVGYLPAISYEIVLRDLEEREIYFGLSGIHVMVQRDRSPTSQAALEPLDTRRVLADEVEIRRAIRLALGDLATARKTEPSTERREKE